MPDFLLFLGFMVIDMGGTFPRPVCRKNIL